ncbi:MAG: MFS transporter [Propionibacteriaceae bacterium]|jgi:MFS family permease|nr:MFS transporter [Propionibacteriaceae bacterium]
MTQLDSVPNAAAAANLKEFAARPITQKMPLTVSLMVGVVAVAFESFAVTAAMPSVFSPEQLGHVRWYAWAFTMFMIGQVFATVVAGRLCDRSGAFQPLGLGLAFFGAGLVMAATSTHALGFLAGRLVQGFGGGLLTVTVMVVLAEAYAGPQRANLMAIFAACYMGPAFVGPIVAGWMASTIGWRWVFWVIVPFVAASAVLGVRPLWQLYARRAGNRAEANPVPIWAAGLVAVGTTLIQAGSQYMVNENRIRVAFIPLVLFGVAVTAFALPYLMPPNAWRLTKGLPAVIGVRFAMAGAFYVCQSFVILLLKEQRGMPASQAGIALAVGAAGYGIGVFLQGRTWMRLRRDQMIFIGALAAVIGLAAMTTYAALTADIYPLMLLGISFTALGMGFSVSSTSLAIVTLSPAERIGRNTSSLQVAEYLGSAFLAGVAGTIYAALHGRTSSQATFGWLFGVQLVFVVAAVWLALRIGPVRNEASGAG